MAAALQVSALVRAAAFSAAHAARARLLIERASKQEVGMLVPLVFMILPVTILFAVFPGVMALQAGF